jgi:hypothetical protein
LISLCNPAEEAEAVHTLGIQAGLQAQVLRQKWCQLILLFLPLSVQILLSGNLVAFFSTAGCVSQPIQVDTVLEGFTYQSTVPPIHHYQHYKEHYNDDRHIKFNWI